MTAFGAKQTSGRPDTLYSMLNPGFIKRMSVALLSVLASALQVGCQRAADDAAHVYDSNKPVLREIVALMRAYPELKSVFGADGYDLHNLDMEFHQVYQGKYSSIEAEADAIRPIHSQVANLAEGIGVESVQAVRDKGLLTVAFTVHGPMPFSWAPQANIIYYDEAGEGLHASRRADGSPACQPAQERFWYVCSEDP